MAGEAQALLPPYLTDYGLWRDLIPIPIFSGIVALVLGGASAPRSRVEYGERAGLLFAFSSLGITVGVITGLSQSPAIGAVLPAVLTLVGGVAVFLLGGKDVPDQQRRVLVLAISGLSLNLLVGVFWGGELRVNAHRIASNLETRKKASAVDFQIAKEELQADVWLSRFEERLKRPQKKDDSVDLEKEKQSR